MIEMQEVSGSPVYRIKQKTKDFILGLLLGGDKRDRTADLLNAIQALSQLSYTPIFCCLVAVDLLNIADSPEKVNP